LNELVVVRGKQYGAFKVYKRIIQCRDRFKVSGLVGSSKDQHIRAGQHHLRQHAPHLFSAWEHSCFLLSLSPVKSILPRKPRMNTSAFSLKLSEPVYKIQVGSLKYFRVFLGVIRLCGSYSPINPRPLSAYLRRPVSGQGGYGQLILSYKHYFFLAFVDQFKWNIIEASELRPWWCVYITSDFKADYFRLLCLGLKSCEGICGTTVWYLQALFCPALSCRDVACLAFEAFALNRATKDFNSSILASIFLLWSFFCCSTSSLDSLQKSVIAGE